MVGHKHMIGDGPIYPKGGGIGKMLGNNIQNIGRKRQRCKWEKEKEERLSMKPKLTIGVNENKISVFNNT